MKNKRLLIMIAILCVVMCGVILGLNQIVSDDHKSQVMYDEINNSHCYVTYDTIDNKQKFIGITLKNHDKAYDVIVVNKDSQYVFSQGSEVSNSNTTIQDNNVNMKVLKNKTIFSTQYIVEMRIDLKDYDILSIDYFDKEEPLDGQWLQSYGKEQYQNVMKMYNKDGIEDIIKNNMLKESEH